MPAVSQQSASMPVFHAGLLRPKFWSTWMGLAVFYLFSWLPISVLTRIGEKLGEIAARRNRKRYNIARANLALCFPDKTEAEIDALVVAHFRCHMRSLMHYGLLWWSPMWRLKRCIVVEGFEQIDEAIDQEQRIIIMTCHTAGLEFSGIALSMHYDCSGPYKPMRNEVINWLVARGRTRLGIIAYTRAEGLRPLIRDTRKGRLLIYLSDEDLGAEVSVFVPFFAAHKATISVLGRLVKSCDAVVYPCVSCYDRQRHVYRVKMLAPMQPYPAGDDVTDAATMNRAIETMVHECLPQYFWSMRLFQTRPEGEPPIYE